MIALWQAAVWYCKSTNINSRYKYLTFPKMNAIARKILAFVDGVHYEHGVEVPPNKKITCMKSRACLQSSRIILIMRLQL